MPGTDDTSDIVSMFQGLPKDRQVALLGRMTPDQKQKLNAALDAHISGTTPAPAAAAPAQPEGYGSEILGGLKRAYTALKGAPDALLHPPDTHYTPAELENQLGPVARVAFNIPASAAQALENAEAQRAASSARGEGWADQALAYMRELPIIGDVTRSAETAGPGTEVGPINVNVSPRNIGAAVEGIAESEGPKAAADATLGGLSKVGKLKEKVRAIAQGKVGASSFETTDKIVDKYNQDAQAAKDQQAASDAKVADKNAQAAQKAAQQTNENQAKVTGKNEAAMNAADIETEQNTAATQEANRRAAETHQKLTQDVQAHNAAVEQAQARADALDTGLKQGSHKIGVDTVDLDAKLRTEGNELYGNVAEKVGKDGVPITDLVEAAREAKSKLRGSNESIKQFNDIAKKEPAESNPVMVNGEDISQGLGTGLAKLMQEQGLMDESGMEPGEVKSVPFSDLTGYSSEIGRKLAQGGLEGDVYQALKYLKQKIDAAKQAVAERNGAGADLAKADNFWNKYLESFYDKDSAVAKVRGNVGKYDPEFYAEPFTKGKSTGLAAQRLRDLPTRHTAEANALADAAETIRGAHLERKGMTIPKSKPLPTAPTPKSTPPRAMGVLQPNPEPVVPKVTPKQTVPAPAAPTVQDIMNEKGERARTQAYGMGRGSKYDVVTAAGALYALGQGHLWTAMAVPAIRFGVPALMKTEGFIKFISQPGEADIAAASKLPAPVRAEVVKNIRAVIDQSKAQGNPLSVSPATRRFIQGATVGAATVRNPREAREALGRANP